MENQPYVFDHVTPVARQVGEINIDGVPGEGTIFTFKLDSKAVAYKLFTRANASFDLDEQAFIVLSNFDAGSSISSIDWLANVAKQQLTDMPLVTLSKVEREGLLFVFVSNTSLEDINSYPDVFLSILKKQ